MEGEEQKGEKHDHPKELQYDDGSEEAILVAFGQTGVGKSTFLSFLSGKDPEEEDDAPFKAATNTAKSETMSINFHSCQMFGTKRMVKLIDMPGMNDTNGKENDVQAIKQLYLTMGGVCEHKYTACLLVINVTMKLTDCLVKMIEVTRCFFEDARIICCFTFQPRRPHRKDVAMKQYEAEFLSRGWHFRGYIDVGVEKAEKYGEFIKMLMPTGYDKLPSFDDLSEEKKLIVISNLAYIYANDGGGCFPEGANVQVGDQQLAIENLQTNQNMTTWDRSMALEDDKLVTFIHRDAKNFYPYAKITTEDESSIEISSRHLIYCKQNEGSVKFIWPKDLKVGDHLIRNDKSFQKITKIEQVVKLGRYAPLSQNGTLIVNGFLVSCYAEYESHIAAHMAFKPLVFKNKINAEKKVEELHGIHPYAQMMIKSFPSQRKIHQADDLKNFQ